MHFHTLNIRFALPVVLLAGLVTLAHAQKVIDAWAGSGITPLSELGFSPQQLDRQPRIIRQTKAVYPPHLAFTGVRGNVTVGFIVNATGGVTELRVMDSTESEFERAALDAVATWTFEPGVKDGKPVATHMAMMLQFVLIEVGRIQQPTAPVSANPANNPRPAPRAVEMSSRRTNHVWEIVPPESFPEDFPVNFRYTQPPQPEATPFPVYPFALLSSGAKAPIDVGVVITPTGRISEVNIIGARPAREFEMSVRAAMNTWVFQPAMRDGQPCFAAVRFTISFSPEGTPTVPVSDQTKKVLAEIKKYPARPVPVEQLDRLPMALSRRRPVFPSFPGNVRPAGSAVVEFIIDEKGDARLPRVVSATNEIFGAAAAQAVATWRFAGPVKDKKPVLVRAQTTIEFSPTDPAAPTQPAP